MLTRGIRLVPTLVNYQSTRGMATIKNIKFDPSTIVQKILQSNEMKAALVEMRPPTPAEIPRAIRDAIGLFKGNWRNITVREAWLNTLVTTEVICWFFVGEVIGKGTFIGYQV